MKRTIGIGICALLLAAGVRAQTSNPPAAKSPAKNESKTAAQSGTRGGALDSVLSDMDKAAASFKSAQADFVWDQFSKVVNDHDIQKGVIYYRVAGNGVQMMSDINDPAKKYVLFSDGKVQVYQPNIDQGTEYATGKNKSEVESFMVLGFGGRGHDLQKSFDVTYAGDETVDGGVKAAKLVLVPKTQKVRNMFAQILLWIDPARGVSVQQQFIEPSGDYRLAKYSNIKLNQKLGDDIFKLKTTSKTKWVRPQS